ncbi:hypothetical protein NP233_g12837 [Leucocoprinus birnbaumii]|uniref:Uncharacterized protein n=1 Tax=Leucocoprinus birnbaumii TaxID=56174 RepID=A0AAD5YMP4_9AGAR|nr:hypothetical protein NP233_g12837 [Leucocoprinus birnbaumii]
MDPTRQVLPKLEAVMARAERLEGMFTGLNGSCAPRNAYRSQNEYHGRTPLVVMGDYVVVLMEERSVGVSYQWLSREEVSMKGRIAHEYKVPMHQQHSYRFETADYHVYHMDHDSSTFYVVSRSSLENKDRVVRVARIKLDDAGKPFLSSCENVVANPERCPSDYMKIRGQYLIIYCYNADLEYDTDINVLNLETKVISQYRCWSEFVQKDIYVSDTHLLWVVGSGTHFCLFDLPRTKDGSIPVTPVNRVPLHPVASGRLLSVPLWRSYQIFHRANPYSFAIVGVATGFPEVKTTEIHFASLRELANNWIVETETEEIEGFHAGGAVFATPSLQAESMLGIFSSRVSAQSSSGTLDGRPKLLHINYQLLHVSGLTSRVGMKSAQLVLTKMDIAPWVDEQVERLRFIDFDPFSGRALLISEQAPELGPGFQTIVVLDWL